MGVNIEEFKDIVDNANYAKFINTNLHLHTPATPQDWNSHPNQSHPADQLTPQKYFEELNKTSLDLVAITDHNTVVWCEPLMELARKGRKDGTSKLHILPGVEITTYEGPHIIAIFPEEVAILPEIEKLLTKLNLQGDGSVSERVSKGEEDQVTITKIIRMVTKLGGLMVGPHIHSKDGVWGSVSFRGREEILNDRFFRILAAPSGDIKLVVENGKRRLLYKNMDSKRIHNSFAFINISDCHRIDDFEKDTTWLKLSEPSLEGIKQIIYEPELRVAHKLILSEKNVDNPTNFEYAIPSQIDHTYIIGIAIEGGFLDGIKLAFSPNQNSIIGKNYAGKSSILDCIRFISDDFKVKDLEAHHKLAGRLEALLQTGGQVRAYVSHNSKIYAISRTLSLTKNKSEFEIEGQSEVYELIEENFRRQSDMNVKDIMKLEVYAQGEVVKLKDNSSKQMIILDSLAKVDNLLKELTIEPEDEWTLLKRVNENSKELIQIENDISSLNQDLKDISSLQKEIDELEELVKSPLLDEIKQWGESESKTAGLIRKITELNKKQTELSDLVPEIEGNQDLIEDLEISLLTHGQLSEYANKIFNHAIQQLSERIASMSFEVVIEKLGLIKEELNKRKIETADKFIVENNADASKAQLAERITEKKEKLDKLVEKQKVLERLYEEIKKKEETRKVLLDEFNNKWIEVREARNAVVEMINRYSPDNIYAELIESSDRANYRSKLDEISSRLTNQSNRITNKQDQLDMISENITPDELIDIVVSGDIGKLMEKSGITQNTAKILIGMGKADLHKLEMNSLQDRFVIKYKKEGSEQYTPIDKGLSGGEQALALLSVAMVPKVIPLVIDQPEDELGTALITKELVEQIRRVKQNRQLIMVTHIANIPVLADSESVIYIRQNIEDDFRKIFPDHTGSLENRAIIAKLLELDGGKYAFAKRNERYSVVIAGDDS